MGASRVIPAPGMVVLLGDAQRSAVSGARRVRVLIASSNPERIMLVRESLHAWPENVVCQLAVNREDAIQHLERHAPHIICWDTALGEEPRAASLGICTILLGEQSCVLPEEQPWALALPEPYIAGLQRSINREYELRSLLVQLRDAHGTETQSLTLLNRASDGIVVVDDVGLVAFVNPAAGVLLGVGCQELLGKRFGHPIPEEGSSVTYQIELPDGVTSPLSATALVSIWDGNEATMIQLQPASRPSVQPSLPPGDLVAAPAPRVSEDRLRALGRLAAGIAHEVNNPLTFVLANLESLRESHQSIRRFIRKLRVDLATQEAITPQSFERIATEVNLQEVIDDASDMLTDCYKGVHRIQDIARSLGTFSRADDDHAELIDITRIIDDACSMVFNQIRYRARLVKQFEPIPTLAAYPGRIAQALVNLLTNAAEAIEGGAYDKHRIVVSTRKEGRDVVVAVSDTGKGIGQEHRDRLFTPGFTTKAHQGGLGLGLSVCRRVAEEHGGRLEVQHLEGSGTRFELVLPVDTGLSAAEPCRESRPISDLPQERPRLLIVDDDAMVLSALRRRLRRRFETATALGGVEALAFLSEDSDFDSIVCDLMMPEVDGKSFYETVVEEHPQLAERIVFMSGGAFTPRLRKFAASVPNPVLQKPVSREDLEAILASPTGPAHPTDG